MDDKNIIEDNECSVENCYYYYLSGRLMTARTHDAFIKWPVIVDIL